MKGRKRHSIEKRLENIEAALANAAEYVAKGVNIEGTSFLHFADWVGKSGHPLWMQNHMIPTTIKARRKLEKTRENLDKKVKDREITRRRREPTRDR